MKINFIEPSVEEWIRPDKDWISHLARIASVSRRSSVGDPSQEKKRVEQCYKQRHVGVFEHWPICLTFAPELESEHLPPWRRLGSKYYGNLRQCLNDWSSHELPLAYIHGFVDMSLNGAPREQMRTFHFTCSRACADQLRTYRTHISHIMESQRYCNFSKLGFDFVCDDNGVGRSRAEAVAEGYDNDMVGGKPPEVARRWLPTCFATRMAVSAPVWKWNYIVEQRAHHATGRAQEEIAGLIRKVGELL